MHIATVNVDDTVRLILWEKNVSFMTFFSHYPIQKKKQFLNSPVATFFSAAEKNAIAFIGVRVFVFRECSYISWNVSGLPRGLDISPRVSCANNFRVIIVTGTDPPVRQTSWPQMPFALVRLESPPVKVFLEWWPVRSGNSPNPWKGKTRAISQVASKQASRSWLHCILK